MAASLQTITNIIKPTVESYGLELYGCEFHGGQREKNILMVYIDGPNGVSIDDCATVSRHIAAVLDVEDPIHGRYDLQVSSPGIERPLMVLDHYQRVIGQRAKLRLRQAVQGQRNVSGVILQVNGDDITLQLTDEITMTVRYDDIDKARLIAEF